MGFSFKTTPYAHQLEALRLSCDREAFALLMEQGTGKSKVLVDTAVYRYLKGDIGLFVVVCPKTLVGDWVGEHLDLHMPDNIRETAVIGSWSRARAETAAGHKLRRQLLETGSVNLRVFVVAFDSIKPRSDGYDFLIKLIKAHRGRALLAVDESSRIKNHKAQRSKGAHEAAHHCDVRRILTGTPVTQSPLDLFSQLKILERSPLGFDNFYAFRARYAEMVRKHLAGGRSFVKVVGGKRLDELGRKLEEVSYRKLKKDCLDLPPKIPMPPRRLALHPEQAKIYKQIRDKAVAELDAMGTVTAALALTRILRLRQVLAGFVSVDPDDATGERAVRWLPFENPKLTELKEMIEDDPAPMIVWAWFRPSIERITDELRKVYGPRKVVSLHGGHTEKERTEAKEAFQSGTADWFVGQTATGGFGLTLTRAEQVVYYDHDWSLEARLQSEDRAHRIGLVHPVAYTDLVFDKTVDTKLLAVVQGKKDVADLVVDGGWRGLLADDDDEEEDDDA